MSNFDPNAILRGAQLTIVGAYRALQNPSLFETTHYKQALLAVLIGIILHLLIATPIFLLRFFLRFFSLLVPLQKTTWPTDLLSTLEFLEKNVLQLPMFLMTAMRYFFPTLDDMFMLSLDWVDRTYLAKHSSEDPGRLRALYYPNLRMYGAGNKRDRKNMVVPFLMRYAKRMGVSVMVYCASFLPHVGRFVLPAVSFYSFNKAAGFIPSAIVFSIGLLIPRHWMVVFLQGYFASRGLMRELLEPYFSRIPFHRNQKRRWFREREGLLFGFGVGFYVLLKVPIFGVLMYGIAEASTAYLITKITDPPPPPSQREGFAETQVVWKNKHEFMKLDLDKIDRLNIRSAVKGAESPFATGIRGGKKGL